MVKLNCKKIHVIYKGVQNEDIMKAHISRSSRRILMKWEFAVHPPCNEYEFYHTHIIIEFETKINWTSTQLLEINNEIVKVESIKGESHYSKLKMHMDAISNEIADDTIISLIDEIRFKLRLFQSKNYFNFLRNFQESTSRRDASYIVWIRSCDEESRNKAVWNFLLDLPFKRHFIMSNILLMEEITNKAINKMTARNLVIFLPELNLITKLTDFMRICEGKGKIIFVTSDFNYFDIFKNDFDNLHNFMVKRNIINISNEKDLVKFTKNPLSIKTTKIEVPLKESKPEENKRKDNEESEESDESVPGDL